MFPANMLAPAIEDFDLPVQTILRVEPFTMVGGRPLLPMDKSQVLEVVQYARVGPRNHKVV